MFDTYFGTIRPLKIIFFRTNKNAFIGIQYFYFIQGFPTFFEVRNGKFRRSKYMRIIISRASKARAPPRGGQARKFKKNNFYNFLVS
eukprot:UN21387